MKSDDLSRVSGLFYLERLTESDLALLATASGDARSVRERVLELRANPDRIAESLASRETFDILFGRRRLDPLLVATPFFVFAVLLAQTSRDLEEVGFVRERVAGRQIVPVFDGGELREFVADPLRRLFLADLLASYTHVASGRVWVKTGRGWRARRFSELDPVGLAQLAETLPSRERPAVYRRLGDLALFLAGVFPDHADRGQASPLRLARLERALEEHGPRKGSSGAGYRHDPPDEAELLEWVGRRSYRIAWEATHPKNVGLGRVVGEVAERFGHARRVLNLLTERYLFPRRDDLFPHRAAPPV